MSRYDAQLALDLAQAALQAYAEQDAPSLLATFSGSVARVIVTQRPVLADELIVAFRGTRPMSIRDWLADGDALLVPGRLPGLACRVHAGFHDALGEVKPQLDQCLAALPRSRLHITGHSLGGAMAALYAAGRRDVDSVYTYGQPRAGDAAFAAHLDAGYAQAYVRVVNDCDIVPRIPGEQWGYAHGGLLALFDRAGKLAEPARMGAASLDVVQDLADHAMDRYVDLLGAYTLAAA